MKVKLIIEQVAEIPFADIKKQMYKNQLQKPFIYNGKKHAMVSWKTITSTDVNMPEVQVQLVEINN